MVQSAGMNTATCSKCDTVLPFDQIEHTLVGAFCRACHVADTADADRLEKAFLRSTGRRQVFIGLVMLAIGIAVLTLTSGAGSLVLVPTGLLIGGVYELVVGMSKL